MSMVWRLWRGPGTTRDSSFCGWTPRRATRSSLRSVVKARTSCGWRGCVDGSRDLGSLTVGLTTPLLESLLPQSQAIDLMKPVEEWVPTGDVLVHHLRLFRGTPAAQDSVVDLLCDGSSSMSVPKTRSTNT